MYIQYTIIHFYQNMFKKTTLFVTSVKGRWHTVCFHINVFWLAGDTLYIHEMLSTYAFTHQNLVPFLVRKTHDLIEVFTLEYYICRVLVHFTSNEPVHKLDILTYPGIGVYSFLLLIMPMEIMLLTS